MVMTSPPVSYLVIEQIDIRSVALLEPENDPPVGADGDAPIACEVAFERVQPPHRQVEMARFCRLIEPRQHARHLVGVLWVYLAAVVTFHTPDHSATEQ
jgi:hypothetical protein